jgi:hypothetical protein
MSQEYDGRLVLAEGLAHYLDRNHLGDGGYSDRWFRINFFWKFTIILPNIPNRVRAVRFHDLHHVLAEYATGLRGEAEIGAWEIASGCGRYYAAWILNTGSMQYGIFLFPRAVYQAFIRGCQSGNLYHGTEYNTELLASTVAEMRERLHIAPASVSARAKDIVCFIFWVAFILVYTAASLFVLYLLVRLLVKAL